MTLFVSLHAYAWARSLDKLMAAEHPVPLDYLMQREAEKGEESAVPGFRTLHRLRRMHGVALCFETSTLIARGRCRAAGVFLGCHLDKWVSIDEDVDADDAALARLVAAPVGVVFAAMRLRAEPARFNVSALHPDASYPEGYQFPVTRAGAALACFTRDAIHQMALCYAELAHVEEVPPFGRVECPGLFLETIEGGAWQGEDVKFCDRARACGVPMAAFVHRGVTHAGLSNAKLLK